MTFAFFFLPFGFPSLSSIIVKKKAQKDNNGSCFCELRFTAGQKRAVERWNFCVKARSVWGDTGVYNPRPGGSPHVCLCAPLIHLQPGSPSSPIPPSLPLFMHPTPPPPPLLTHTCKRTLCPHCIQSCSPSSLAAPTAPRRHLGWGLSWRRAPRHDPDLLFYALLFGTEPNPFSRVDKQRKCGWVGGWVGGLLGEAERQLKPEVASSRLGPRRCSLSERRRRFSQKLHFLVVSLWKAALRWTEEGLTRLLTPGINFKWLIVHLLHGTFASTNPQEVKHFILVPEVKINTLF